MIEETLFFQSPRVLSELYCGMEENLVEVEKALGANIVSRDDWIKISGEEQPVALAKEFFQLLEMAKRQGMRITRSDFSNLLKLAASDAIEEMREIFHNPIQIELRSKSVVPKSLNQKRYLQSIARRDIVFGIGPAGTGKTYLAVAAALRSLLEEKVERVILTRPAVEAGEALGFLPGDLTEKIQPYLLPLYDAIYDMMGRVEGRRLIGLDGDRKEERTTRIEIAPLAYMRGRTLSNAFVILDEAQNTTPEQMMMFLTRLGDGSRMVITGDKTQIDLPRHKYSGLKEAEKVLVNIPGVDFHYFEGKDVVRNPIVQHIINAYARYEAKTGAHQPREVSPD
ncbi:MAG TPA: PhoH family protein [Oceanipulchritudo sp.]|nr:PhoH family protein [Oceanipulchritudo sp.]